jgi:thiamine biosynthesis lipoprotein
MEAELRFRAMGSDVHLVVVAPRGARRALLERAAARIDQLERRWSRFRDDSEVLLLNALAGAAVEVSADTVLLVRRACEAWRLSGGAFDPTVLGPLLRAGYDRSFAELGSYSVAPSSPLGLGAADITIDGACVTLPAGTGFDPGGIGKGLAADLVVTELLAAGADGACVNLGGDVRVAGVAPDGGAWTVAIEHPRVGRLGLVGLADGAVATSTTLRRRWMVDGEARHHLIDPRSGRPAETDVELASVIAAEAWVAEALTKSVMLRTAAVAFDVVEGTAGEALAVDTSGRILTTPGLTAYLGGHPLVA